MTDIWPPQARRHAAARNLMQRITELTPQADQHVKEQHVVSEVVLKQFATPGGAGAGLQVQPFDLHHPDRRPRRRHPSKCGYVTDFVQFASASLEGLWSRVERLIPAALAAHAEGTLLQQPRYLDALRDLIALHWARSLRYMALHHDTFAAVLAQQREALLGERRGFAEAAALEVAGFHPTGQQGIEWVVDRLLQPARDSYDSGALIRVRMEEMFETARDNFRTAALEILVPASGEFLIGDTPAVPLHQVGNRLYVGMALGEAQTVILPLTPRVTLALAREHSTVTLPYERVAQLNLVQIRYADRFVFHRPHGPNERFMTDAVKQLGSRLNPLTRTDT